MMIKHYFKLALRNLLKYKMQSVISIIGLAVGFTCFALANLWIHYEVSYDSNPKGADRFYILYQSNPYYNSGYSPYMPYPLSTMLVNEFPEVEAACAYSRWKGIELQAEGQPAIETHEMIADSCMMNMFGVTVASGNMDFMYSDEQIALTEETAMRMFGTKDVLGKEIKVDGEKRLIGATLKNLKHSNLSFDFWGHGKYIRTWQKEWGAGNFYTIIQLRKGVDPVAFQKKLASKKANTDSQSLVYNFEGIQLMPLSQYRNSALNEEISIKFNYLILFSVSGGLVILCSLLNYLSLFVTRMRMRNREIELRTVCGSTRSSLFLLFATEYIMLILLAGAVGMALVEIVLPAFRKMSEVSGNIYIESLIFFVGVVFISILFLLPFTLRRTYKNNKNKNEFRKVSIIVQLIISILFMFCMSVIMKQIFFLKNADLGWDRKNIAVFPLIYPNDQFDEIAYKVEQMSCTREVLKQHLGLLPKGGCLNLYINEWEGKPDSIKEINMMAIPEGERLAKFYNLKLLKGEMVKEGDRKKVMINEAAAKTLGLKDPIGENIYWGEQKSQLTIVGLLKDFHTSPPTIPVTPILLIGENGTKASFWGKKQILIKFHEGQWNELKTKVENMFLQEYPDVRYKLVNVEDEYNQYLKSEDTLLKLLGFISFVCILIAIFGIFSLVTLSCEQRRKEIAVRKVNGASIKDILAMFGKEYMLLLVTASVIAFPVGYVLMKQWLQSYIEQTTISSWIYMAIFAEIAFIITICIGWRVWQAARQNPAKTIKAE